MPNNRKHYLLLLFITLLAYWPLTFSVFSLKNDALIYFLPYRYHVSEAIQNGEFPWWSPWLYSGLPLHSDIQSGVWNPVVMLISCFTTYNMTVLQWELLLYLFIAAIGMYKLVKELGGASQTSFLAAVVYLCCGFMTDSGSFIPWISNAAYLPFVFCYFLRLSKKPVFSTALKLSLSLALLLTAGYPSFFIFAMYILLAAAIVIIYKKHRQAVRIGPFFKFFAIAVLVFLLLCSPAILSWFDFFDYYERGKGTSLEKAVTGSFPLFSTVSYLFPSAVYKEHSWLNTDVSLRNASVGIFMLIFFLLALLRPKTVNSKFVIAVIIFSFLFSLGDATPLREWCYHFIPLMDSFRHPSCMRLYTTIGIILISIPVIDLLWKDLSFIAKPLKKISIILILLIAAFVIYYFVRSGFIALSSLALSKETLDKLGFADLVILQGIIQLGFLGLFVFILYKKKTRFILPAVIANLLLLCFIAQPFTFFSQLKTSDVNKHIASFPKGFPVPDAKAPINAGMQQPDLPAKPFNDNGFYSKIPMITGDIISPTVNTRYHEFLLDTQLRNIVNDYPFAYFSDSSFLSMNMLPDSGKIVLFDRAGRQQPIFEHTKGNIVITGISANSLEMNVTAEQNGLLNIFQQYHHGWRAWANDVEIPVYRSNKAFMSVPIPSGQQKVIFRFEEHILIKWAMYISAGILLLIAIFFIFRSVKSRNRL
ncbi:MAG: YfhO family protein [Chitinophagaceae bacterium]|nr:YfhO family protein [Chitinophagaceae bacterium]